MSLTIKCSVFLCVLIEQSSSSTAEQGELVSRIKSLELENHSLHKGGFVWWLALVSPDTEGLVFRVLIHKYSSFDI